MFSFGVKWFGCEEGFEIAVEGKDYFFEGLYGDVTPSVFNGIDVSSVEA